MQHEDRTTKKAQVPTPASSLVRSEPARPRSGASFCSPFAVHRYAFPAPRSLSPRSARAFTLIELVLVVCIVGILASVAIPRMANTLARQRAVAAANRIVSDLRLAQAQARLTSAAKTVQFNVGTSSYRLVGVASPDRKSETYTVYLSREPYEVTLGSANFGGDANLVFDGYGTPDSGGSVVVQGGGHTMTISVDPDSGKATVTDSGGTPVVTAG